MRRRFLSVVVVNRCLVCSSRIDGPLRWKGGDDVAAVLHFRLMIVRMIVVR